MDKKAIIGNERTEEQQESPQRLQFMIAAYERQQKISAADKQRVTEMMQRKGAKKWDSSKKQQMVRRLMRSDQMVKECESTLDQLRHRLSQVTTEAPSRNVAPFVPPPATST